MTKRRFFFPGQLLDHDLLNTERDWHDALRQRHIAETHNNEAVTAAQLESTQAGPSRTIAESVTRLAFERVAESTRQALFWVNGRVRLKLSWKAGRQPTNQFSGRTSSERFSSCGLVFPSAQLPPEKPQPRPFRLYRRAADTENDLPEALVMETGPAINADPQHGFAIGQKRFWQPAEGAVSDGRHNDKAFFLRHLTVLSGGGVRVAGQLIVQGAVIKRPPEEPGTAQPPSDEELTAAWLRTPEGQTERKKIEEEARRDFKLDVLEPQRLTQPARFAFRYRIRNKSTMDIRNLHLYAAVVPVGDVDPVIWRALPPPPESTIPADGSKIEERAQVPLANATATFDLRVFVAGHATYDVPVTAFTFKKVEGF